MALHLVGMEELSPKRLNECLMFDVTSQVVFWRLIHTCSKLNMTIGRVKTKVFPDPVNAMPIISRPVKLKHHHSLVS